MRPDRCQLFLLLLSGVAVAPLPVGGQRAAISESVQVIPTYPFSEPNRVPILTRDARLYPYHSFEGYSTLSVPREWKVVKLENELIEVFVLPEVGGKVWGAVVKQSGNEFIYRNEVLKFRNIALRGPWTSGGIEFNFGVIGHTPSTATPVDYVLRENPDGSVSCIIGMMDLPSRTHWRVEIRLAPGRGAFETNVLWYNPTTLEQPYYNWMTAAAPASDDLMMTIPGDASLGHPGDLNQWPLGSDDRLLPRYRDNDFGSNKSYHVVGELADFFGGYYDKSGYGFGHWSPYDQMPGQKLWLWALSPAGQIWEELLTDTDGQYVEYQAGRLLVQYSPSTAKNPISQVGFEAGATDRWTETWFPLENTGGLTAASRAGAIHTVLDDGQLRVTVTSFEQLRDTMIVTIGDRSVTTALSLPPLVPVTSIFPIGVAEEFRVSIPALSIDHHSDPSGRTLSRPWTADSSLPRTMDDPDQIAREARQLLLGRRLPEARREFNRALGIDPGHTESLHGMAELEFRRGRYEEGLVLARRLLTLDGYDARANFTAANIFRALGQTADAVDGYAWAARSLRYRSVANIAMAEIHLKNDNLIDAARHANQAIDFDRFNLPAREVLAIIARRTGQEGAASALRREMLQIDPLHRFVLAESLLSGEGAARNVEFESIGGEYPNQLILELAIDYLRRGSTLDASTVLSHGNGRLAEAWRAWLTEDATMLSDTTSLDFVFPYRTETIPVLRWAAGQRQHWSWSYLFALNLWANDRGEEAARLVASLDGIDYAPALVARASLLQQYQGVDPEDDLASAVRLDPADRAVRIELISHLQQSERWGEASQLAAEGRDLFPGDFNLDLLEANNLLRLNRPLEAITILEQTQVLPSEHSRGSHQLYQQAHLMAAMNTMDSDNSGSARAHLTAALDWPPHLGQGRPYQPEERLVRYLLGIAEMQSGDSASAGEQLQLVIDASAADATDGLNILGRWAQVRLGIRETAPLPTIGSTDLDAQLLHRALRLSH